MRLTTCTYFMPLRIWCCTLKRAFMRNVEPSLIVKGCLFRSSKELCLLRSMIMSGLPWTSSPRDRMMHLRGSLGSDVEVPEPMPRDSFHLRRDSSFWSVIVGRQLCHTAGVDGEHSRCRLLPQSWISPGYRMIQFLGSETGLYEPSCSYSLMSFFSPTLKPSVCSA